MSLSDSRSVLAWALTYGSEAALVWRLRALPRFRTGSGQPLADSILATRPATAMTFYLIQQHLNRDC